MHKGKKEHLSLSPIVSTGGNLSTQEKQQNQETPDGGFPMTAGQARHCEWESVSAGLFFF